MNKEERISKNSLSKKQIYLVMSQKSSNFAAGIEIMRRHLYIVWLLMALVLGVCSSNNCRKRLMENEHKDEATTYGTIVDSYGISNSAEQHINFILSTSDCALPVQVAKIQIGVVQLSAHQQLKRISETIFGHNANTITTQQIARRIFRSRHILLNLETYDIGFPFSAFW